MRLIRYTYPKYRSLAPAFGSFARSPWSGLETELDRLFETALRDFGGSAAPDQFPVDIYQDNDHTYVRAELPGFSREAVNVELAEGYLTVTATRKATDDADQAISLTRSVHVGDQVETAAVSASFEHGVLTVTLPKREEAKPKKVAVTVK